MIVGKCFHNDNNEKLKIAQDYLYKQLIGDLFKFPKERFVKSVKLLNEKQDILNKLLQIQSIDHRVFQYAHDLIAAYFRYSYNKLTNKESSCQNSTLSSVSKDYIYTGYSYEYDNRDHLYPGSKFKDCNQLQLFDINDSYMNCLKKNWLYFFHQELLYLTYNEDEFTKAALMAVLNQNQHEGYEAEYIMTAILYYRYDCMEWYNNHDKVAQNLFKSHFKEIHKKYPWNIELKINDISTKQYNGYIYILFSPSLKKNIYKIGKTKRNPETRAKELSRHTGVPTYYLVAYEEPVIDCDNAEKMIHKILEKYRINSKREFFNIELKNAIKVVRRVSLKLEKLNTLP